MTALRLLHANDITVQLERRYAGRIYPDLGAETK